MSKMCSMEGCAKQHGMCGHERMMAVLMAMGLIGGTVYWLLG